MTEKDKVIWDDFRQGNEKVFPLIYHQFSPILYQYGFRFSPNSKLIEDAIQDLFIDLIRNRQTIGSTDNIRLYLLKSFRRKLLRALNKEKRYTLGSVPELNFGVHISVEDSLIQNEDERLRLWRLNQALEKLTSRQREAIYLRFKRELDYCEVAEILDMSIEASRNLISRAVKAVRQILAEENLQATYFAVFQILKKF